MRSILLAVTIFIGTFSASSSANLILNEVFIGDEDYIELVNIGDTDIDLFNFQINFFESSSAVFTFSSSLILAPGAILVVGEESSHDVDVGFNIVFDDLTPFSITLFNALGSVLDFMSGQGTSNINVPVGISFAGGPLADISDDDVLGYQRLVVTSSGGNFFASDWVVAAPSEGAGPIASHAVDVPEPSIIALLTAGLVLLRFTRKRV